MDGAWLRPRFDGYMDFQNAAARRLNVGLQAGERGGAVIEDLNRLYKPSGRDGR